MSWVLQLRCYLPATKLKMGYVLYENSRFEIPNCMLRIPPISLRSLQTLGAHLQSRWQQGSHPPATSGIKLVYNQHHQKEGHPSPTTTHVKLLQRLALPPHDTPETEKLLTCRHCGYLTEGESATFNALSRLHPPAPPKKTTTNNKNSYIMLYPPPPPHTKTHNIHMYIKEKHNAWTLRGLNVGFEAAVS